MFASLTLRQRLRQDGCSVLEKSMCVCHAPKPLSEPHVQVTSVSSQYLITMDLCDIVSVVPVTVLDSSPTVALRNIQV